MASSKGRPQTSPGPWGWENSRGKLAGRPRLGTIEIGCYTDLSFQWAKPVSIGPYTIMVPLSLTEIETMLSLVGRLRMGLVPCAWNSIWANIQTSTWIQRGSS